MSVESAQGRSATPRILGREVVCADGGQGNPAKTQCSQSTSPLSMKQQYPNMHAGHLPFRRLILWVLPFLGWFALKYLKVGWMKKFYVDDYPKASLGIIAMSSVLSTLVDAFTDPKMATVTDTFKSKHGRRRPFVLASAFFVPLVMVLGWTPVGDRIVASIWFGVMHIGFKLADTLFVMPTEAWMAQLTPIYFERTMCWFWRDFMANIGILVGMAVIPVAVVTEACTSTPGSGCPEFPFIATAFGFLFMMSCLLLVFFGEEPPTCEKETRVMGKQHSPRFTEDDPVPMLISTLQHNPFRILLIADIAKALGQDVPFNIMPFTTAWVVGQKCLDADRLFSLIVIAGLLCSIVSMVVWRVLVRRLNKLSAYLVMNIAVTLSSLSYIIIGEDSGDCVQTQMTIVIACLHGIAFGGTFLIKDLLCDAVDYDELLAGGRRREAYYYMAIEFIPKFMNIPGESVPFLFMAYFNYARPLEEEYRIRCGGDQLDHVPSWDQYCDMHYRNETPGANWCSDTTTCAQLVSNGVSFICNTSSEECGVRQNAQVVLLLRVCFAIVPFIVGCCAVTALYFYPKEARSKEAYDRLFAALELQRQGHIVEDPYRAGHFIPPAAGRGPHDGTLSYFWSSELRAALGTGSDFNVGLLMRRPLVLTCLFATLLPAGGVLIIMGVDDMADDLGASVSPLGLMMFGLGMLGTWFHGVRCWAARTLQLSNVTREEVVARHDQLCAFTGKDRIVPLDVHSMVCSSANQGIDTRSVVLECAGQS